MKNRWKIYKHSKGGWILEHIAMGPWSLMNSFEEIIKNYPDQIRQFNSLYGIKPEPSGRYL